jgi:hypothetical protein
MTLSLYNLAVSWGLLSLIWLVQTIIYPGFASIPAADFAGYHRWYVKRISAVVAPLMIGEALIAVAWLQRDNFSSLSSLSAFLVAVVWISTIVLQVPIHRHLEAGKDLPAIRRLVATNWIRTASWTVKTLVVTVNAAGGL